MRQIIRLQGRLPGENEIIDAAKKHHMTYADMKKTHTEAVAWQSMRAKKHKEPVRIRLTWHEPNARRDPDNIMAGAKFVLDGLVMARVLPNDGQKNILSIEHGWVVDKEWEGVVVELWEGEE